MADGTLFQTFSPAVNASEAGGARGGSSNLVTLTPAILYTSLMMVMGVVGNSVVVYVYGTKWKSSVTRLFILSLAMMDLVNSLVCMPTEIVMLVHIVNFDGPVWCKISRFLTYTLNGASSLILLFLAIYRWLQICRPHYREFNIPRARVTCVASVVIAVVLSSPSLLLYGNLTVPIVGDPAGRMGVTCLVSDEYIDTDWPFLFYCVYFTCYLLLVVSIVVLYSLLWSSIWALERRKKARKRQTNGRIASAADVVATNSRLDLRPQIRVSAAKDDDVDGDIRHSSLQVRSSAPLDVLASAVASGDGAVRCGGGGGGDGDGGGDGGEVCTVEIHEVDERTALLQNEGSPAPAPAPAPTEVMEMGAVSPGERRSSQDSAETGEGKGDGEERARSTKDVASDFTDSHPQREPQPSGNPQSSSAASSNVDAPFAQSGNERADTREEESSPATTTTATTTIDGAAAPTNALSVMVPRPLDSRLVARLSSQSHSSSLSQDEDNNASFERGIHFASPSDIHWQHNPIAGAAVPFADCDAAESGQEDAEANEKEGGKPAGAAGSSANGDDRAGDESSSEAGSSRVVEKEASADGGGGGGTASDGGNSVAASGDTANASRSNCSDYANATATAVTASTTTTSLTTTPSHDSGLLGVSDVSGSFSAAPPLLKPSGEASMSRASSLLALPGGYPGGHTPVSRLPSPAGTPSRGKASTPVSAACVAKKLQKDLSYHKKMSIMLFVISLVFIASFFPFFCIVLTRASKGMAFLASLSDAEVVVVSIFIRSSFISNAANPIIYGMCNKDFRREVNRLLARFSRRRPTSRVVVDRGAEHTGEGLDSKVS